MQNKGADCPDPPVDAVLSFHTEKRPVTDHSRNLPAEGCVASLECDLVIQAQLEAYGLPSEQGDTHHRGENRKPDHHFRGNGAPLSR